MAEPALHFSVPFAILTFAGVDPVLCCLASAIAILPDFDVFFKVHRSVSHSLVLYLPIAFVGVVFLSTYPSFSEFVLAVWLSLSSHAILDVFGGFSPILWPLSKEEVSVVVRLNLKFLHSFRLNPLIAIERRTSNLRPFEDLDVTALTAEGVAISALLLVVSLFRLPAV